MDIKMLDMELPSSISKIDASAFEMNEKIFIDQLNLLNESGQYDKSLELSSFDIARMSKFGFKREVFDALIQKHFSESDYTSIPSSNLAEILMVACLMARLSSEMESNLALKGSELISI